MIGSLPLGFPGFSLPGGVYGMAALGLGLVSAAYMAEPFARDCSPCPTGQMEAARSLGMSYSQAMSAIIIPQAIRVVIPPLPTKLVLLFKDSSLVLFLGVTSRQVELSKSATIRRRRLPTPRRLLLPVWTYLLITIPLGYLARRLELRQARGK
jgi:polar amino acid transport system permease protein